MKLIRAAIHAYFVAASLAVQCDSIKELYQTASLTTGETGCCENTHGEFDSSTCVTGHSDKGIYNRKVKDVSISYDDSLVLVQTTTNELFGFGWNHHGQIDASAGPYDFSLTGMIHKHNGIIMQGDPSLPQITVDGHRTFKTMASGGNWSAAVTMDHKVVLWGNTTMAGTVNAHPLNAATSVTNVKDVQAGRNYLLVLTNAGDVYCFGKATHYQCGPMTSNGKMNLGGAATSIRAGLDHSMFIIGKRLKTCGRNNYGQLIRGTNVSHGCVTESEMGANLPFADIGTSMEFQGSTEDTHLMEVDDVCGGMYHTSVNTKDGVKIFGDNRYGQFGNGNPMTYATGRWLTNRGTPLPNMRGHSPKTVGNYVPYWSLTAGCVNGNLGDDDQGYSMCPNDEDGSYTRDPSDLTKKVPYGSGRPMSSTNYFKGKIACGRFHTYYRHFGNKNVWTLGDNAHGQHAWLPRPSGARIDEFDKFYYDDNGNKFKQTMRYNSPATSDWYWMKEDLSPAKYGSFVNFPMNEATGEQEKTVVPRPGVSVRFVPKFVNRIAQDQRIIVVDAERFSGRGGGLYNHMETQFMNEYKFPTFIDTDGNLAFSEMNVTLPIGEWFYLQTNAGEFHSPDMKILNVQDGAQLNLNYDTSNDRFEYTVVPGSVRPWMRITRDVETLQYRLNYAVPSPVGNRDVTGMKTFGEQNPDMSQYSNAMIFGGGNLGVAVNRDLDSDATGGSLVVFGSTFHMGGAPWDETVGIIELNINGIQSLMGYRYPDGEQESKIGWYHESGPRSSFAGKLYEVRKNATDNTSETVQVGVNPYLLANYFSEEGNEEPWNAPFGYVLGGSYKNESQFAYHTGSASVHVNLNRDAVDIEFYDQGFGWVHGYKSTVENADFLSIDTTIMPPNKAYKVTCPTSSFTLKYTVGTTIALKDGVSTSTPPALPNSVVQTGTVGNHTIQAIMYFGTVRSSVIVTTPTLGMSLSELVTNTPYPGTVTVTYDTVDSTGTDACDLVVKDVPVTSPANLLGAYVINEDGVANIESILINAGGWPSGSFAWLKGQAAKEFGVPGTAISDWWTTRGWLDVTDARYFDKVSRPVHMVSPVGIQYWSFVKGNPMAWAEGVTAEMKADFEDRFVAPGVVIPDKYLAYISTNLHGKNAPMANWALDTFSEDTVYYANQFIVDYIVKEKKTDLFLSTATASDIEWYQDNVKEPFYLADEDLKFLDVTKPGWPTYKPPIWMLNTFYNGGKASLPLLSSVSDFYRDFLHSRYGEAGITIREDDKEYFDEEQVGNSISQFTIPTPLPA